MQEEVKTSTIVNLESFKNEKNIRIKNAHYNLYEEYYKESFLTNADYVSFVKKVVRLARSSNEYSYYIGYLINELNIDSCFVLSNIDVNAAEIEMHHYPFTIYDIANAVVTKRLDKRQPVSSLLCAREVMKLHYKNMIGLVPTSITVHELAHAGDIFIPLNTVFGNFQEFVEEYSPYISPMLLEKYNVLLEKTERNDVVDFEGVLVAKPIKWAVNEDEYDGNHL